MKQKRKSRKRKSREIILNKIIDEIAKSKYENISVETIRLKLNSNWATIDKYLGELENLGIVRAIKIEGKTRGYSLNKLNKEDYDLLKKFLNLKPISKGASEIFDIFNDKTLEVVEAKE